MTIKEIIINTINQMNNDKTYRRVYPYIQSGALHKLVEVEIIEQTQKYFPHLNIYHPNDNSGKPDLYTDRYNKGIEIKATFGWPTYYYKKKTGERIKRTDDGCVVWTNGTVQTSTEYFLFIKLSMKNGLLVVDNIWFGHFSYNNWHIHPSGGLRIRKSLVKKLCKQIK